MFVRGSNGRGSLSEKVKGLGRDVRKRISRLRPQRSNSKDEITDNWMEDRNGDFVLDNHRNHQGNTLSPFSPPSTSSSPSSMSVEDEEPVFRGPFVGRARVIRDCTPSPYDKDALTLKRGDIISVISKADTGIWTGMVRSKVGTFKFINVELIPDPSPQTTPLRARHRCPRSPRRPRPRTVQELLARLQLQHLTNTFLLHGFETLELLSTLEEEDLDELAITNAEDRAKLLTAAQMLLDYEDVDNSSSSSSPVITCHQLNRHTDLDAQSYSSGNNIACMTVARVPPLHPVVPHVRDSGCYASVETLQQGALEIVDLDEINLNGNMNPCNGTNDNAPSSCEECLKDDQAQRTSIVTHNLTYQTSESRNHILPQNNRHCPLQSDTVRLLSYEKFTFKSASSENLGLNFENGKCGKLSALSKGSSDVEKSGSSPALRYTGSQRSLCDSSRTHSIEPQGSPRSILKNRDSPSPVSCGGTQTPPAMSSPPVFRAAPPGHRMGHITNSPLGSPVRGRSPSGSPPRAASPHSSPNRSPYLASPLASPNRTPSPHGTPVHSALCPVLGSPQRLRANPPPLPVRVKPAVPERRSSLQQRYLTSSCGQTYVYTPVTNGDGTWRANVDYANLPKEEEALTNGRVDTRRLSTPALQLWTPPSSPLKSKLPTLQGSVSLQSSPQTSPLKTMVRHESLLSAHRAPRPVSVTLEALVMAKIEAEGIDLTEPPYTDKCGFCGIPPALVQRYSEELKRDILDLASVLDEGRMKALHNMGRAAVPNDFLGDTCSTAMVDVSCSSLADFLTSVGLPMYLQTLIKSDVRNLDKVREMGELDWRKCGITDPRHLRRLTAATDILKLKRHAPIRKLSEVRDKV